VSRKAGSDPRKTPITFRIFTGTSAGASTLIERAALAGPVGRLSNNFALRPQATEHRHGS